jgi:hypothetical protein
MILSSINQHTGISHACAALHLHGGDLKQGLKNPLVLSQGLVLFEGWAIPKSEW